MRVVETHLKAHDFLLSNGQAKPLNANTALLDQSCPVFQNDLLPPPPESIRLLPLLS